MNKLTTERLEEIAKLEITEFSNGMDIAKDAYQSVGSSEIVLMARQLLAYEQAAKNPAAKIKWDGSEFSVTNVSSDFYYGTTDVYLAPVLPKQPELVGMKVSIDTGSDNIGHRLFGEIVGTSESNGVPVLCIEVTENNVDVAAPAQPVIPEQRQRISDDDFVSVQRSVLACAGYAYRKAGLKDRKAYAELKKYQFAPAITAQPVSEPYKLNSWISVDSELPEEGARVLAFSDGAFVLMTEFTGGEFYDVVRNGGELFETVTRCVTHWMPLPAAPAQESE